MTSKRDFEEAAKDRFLEFLDASTGHSWQVGAENVVVDPATGVNFDYELFAGGASRPIALELFRLVDDRKDLAQHRVWNEMTGLLRENLAALGVAGYLITTPPFQIAKVRRQVRAKELADRLHAAIESHPHEHELTVEGFTLEKIDGLGGVEFARLSGFGAYDPISMALNALEAKLPDKNRQLAIGGHDRVIVISNWEFLVSIDALISAISRIDFAALPNIDKVYFDAHDKVILAFDRELFDALDVHAPPPDSSLEDLYVDWLADRLQRRDRGALETVKRLTAERGQMLWLPASAREDMVWFGRDLLAGGHPEDAWWIVDHLANDPDPPLRRDRDNEDGERPTLHQRTEGGEDVRIIASVRGAVCWLLQNLVAANDVAAYSAILDILEKYVRGEDLYVRQQSAVPLVELVRRLHTRNEDGSPFMPAPIAARVRGLVLDHFELCKPFPALLPWTANLIVNLRDLSTSEALGIAEGLIEGAGPHRSQIAAAMILYHAFSREGRFSELGTFDGEPFRRLVMNQVEGGSPEMRMAFVAAIGDLLDGGVVNFDSAAPALTAFTSGPWCRQGFHELLQISAQRMQSHPRELAALVRRAVARERAHWETEPKTVFWHSEEMWSMLEAMVSTGETAIALECLSDLLAYRARIQGFPVARMERLLHSIGDPNIQPEVEHLRSELHAPL